MAMNAMAVRKNVGLFVWYRVLFNARFYYPVLAVFFTDLGLSVGQFIWLNAIWAIVIVLAEVPSGVLADWLGRRRLVQFSAASMVVEMVLLLLAPVGGGVGLFLLCAANRLLSGLAEAAASGADEALAYDSMRLAVGDEPQVLEREWDGVLYRLMRWQSVGMVVAMVVGGLVFDHERMVDWLGVFPRELSLKMPIVLCLLSACVCFWLSCRLVDVDAGLWEAEGESGDEVDAGSKVDAGRSLALLWRRVLEAASWLLALRWLAWLVVGIVLIDMVVRTFATLVSTFFRSIDLPEWSFGFLGALMAMGGLVVPIYAKRLSAWLSPQLHVFAVGLLAAAGLAGALWLPSWWAIVPCFVLLLTMSHVGFLQSRFLNRAVPSRMRASVLSVSSLSRNLGYGVFSALFALSLAGFEGRWGEGGGFRAGMLLMLVVLVVVMLGWLFWAQRASGTGGE